MADHLSNAFALADHYRASVKAADSAGAMLAGSTYGLDAGYNKLTQAREQFSNYKGWVYTAIRSIAQRIAGQSVYVGRLQARPTGRKVINLPRSLRSIGERVEPLATHELLKALDDPNPLQVRWSLLCSTASALLLTGRAHWWLNDNGEKLEIWPIPAHWLRPADQLRGSWYLRPDNSTDEYTLPNDDVLSIFLPDPSSPFGCVSPLQSQAAAVATDEAIQQTQYRSFRDGIVPALMIRVGKVPGALPGEEGQRPVLEAGQRQELVETISRLYRGAYKRNEPLIVDGLIEGVEKLSNTPAEMDYLVSSQQTKNRILQAFGVNPIIVGEIEGANRASAAVAGQQFCDSTVNPLCELVSESMTQWLARRYGENLVCWIDPCRADDDELKLRQWQVARVNGDVTPNEYRTNILNLPPIDGGDARLDMLGNPLGEERSYLPEFSTNGHLRY